jgi:exodeoxyribonuclease VII large subunit
VTDGPVTVGEVTSYIRDLLECDEALSDLWIEGEVSEVFTSRAGHCYFTLVDDDAKLRCVIFRHFASRQRTRPTVGGACTAHGRVSVYERDGTYQLYVDLLQPAGIGLRALEFELLRQTLEAEGLFDPARKRMLPASPGVVGVVTSEEGAVWHDIQSVMRRRNPFVELIIAPTQVQGDRAPEGIIRALDLLQADGRSEVIIVARGGGSAEDLAWFNHERLLRQAFACRIPIVSAIGHDSDWTLFDYVADLRAPTPSVAAELCSPNVLEKLEIAHQTAQTLRRRAIDCRERRQRELYRACSRLEQARPSRQIKLRRGAIGQSVISVARAAERSVANRANQGQQLGLRLRLATRSTLDRMGTQMVWKHEILSRLDPGRTLARGYQLVTDPVTGEPITSVTSVTFGQTMRTRFRDGEIESTVDRIAPSR